jgi:hypothetical protein
MTLLCRDDEDIVGHSIAYHLAQGVDFIIATDNASVDRTPDILRGFERAGKLKLIHEPGRNFDQDRWVTRMARMAAAEYGAEWVINSDTDEFWLSTKSSLRDALLSFGPDVQALAVRRYDLIPPAGDGWAPFFESMTVRAIRPASRKADPRMWKVCHRGFADVSVVFGNHNVRRGEVRINPLHDHPLEILHFPIRSMAQFELRLRQGAEAVQANERLSDGFAQHWSNPYRDYVLTGRMAELYANKTMSDDRIAAGLASGTLEVDTRVRDALRQINDPVMRSRGS